VSLIGRSWDSNPGLFTSSCSAVATLLSNIKEGERFGVQKGQCGTKCQMYCFLEAGHEEMLGWGHPSQHLL
jgi:hypothetical protein